MAPNANGDISIIWGYQGFGISQEFGRTAFSLANSSWYAYGAQFGMDGVSHPGLDISMGRGTWLYSPVDGTVVVSGNSAGFTFYGNGNAQVGELTIRTNAGHEVVLGHMGRIAVGVGEYVTVGQFVGVSGGYNGDHLHLETRQSNGGWLQAVDPRGSFLVASIAQAATDQAAVAPDASEEETAAEDTIPVAPTLEPRSPEEIALALGGENSVQYASAEDEATDAPEAPATGSDAVIASFANQASGIGQHAISTLGQQAVATAEPESSEPDEFGPMASVQQIVHEQAVILSSRYGARTTIQFAIDPSRLIP